MDHSVYAIRTASTKKTVCFIFIVVSGEWRVASGCFVFYFRSQRSTQRNCCQTDGRLRHAFSKCARKITFKFTTALYIEWTHRRHLQLVKETCNNKQLGLLFCCKNSHHPSPTVCICVAILFGWIFVWLDMIRFIRNRIRSIQVWTLIWLPDEMRSCFVLLLSSVTSILYECDDFIAFSLIINNREIINRVAIYRCSLHSMLVMRLFFSFSLSFLCPERWHVKRSKWLSGWFAICVSHAYLGLFGR